MRTKESLGFRKVSVLHIDLCFETFYTGARHATEYDDLYNGALAEALDKARESETMEEWHKHYADGMDVLRHSPATGEDWVKQREHFSDTLFRDADPTGLPDFERFEQQGGPADEAFRIGRDAHVMRKTMEQDHDNLMARAAQGELVAEKRSCGSGWNDSLQQDVGPQIGLKQKVMQQGVPEKKSDQMDDVPAVYRDLLKTISGNDASAETSWRYLNGARKAVQTSHEFASLLPSSVRPLTYGLDVVAAPVGMAWEVSKDARRGAMPAWDKTKETMAWGGVEDILGHVAKGLREAYLHGRE